MNELESEIQEIERNMKKEQEMRILFESEYNQKDQMIKKLKSEV